MEKPAKNRLLVVVAAVVVAAAALFLVLGRSGSPGDASAEAGFARDMAIHHAQAIDMSFTIRDKTESKDIRNLAYDIITTQGAQRGMFYGWLQAWGLPQNGSQPAMTWMSHGAHAAAAATTGVMPGMASAAELQKLKELTGKDAEVQFLQLMIRHHEGGVQMAQGLLAASSESEVVNMAQKIVAGQTSEIKLMTDMLRQRGAQPLPSILK
ncbi:MAG: DUF305 domain-containing protein [Nonomuraea sp.]|nr:DUF305 domain-containing protein [Nonomuraea sp.]